MDDHCVLARGTLPAWPHWTATAQASPLARSPLPHPRLPQAPCASCNVRHLCLAEVGEQGGEILDGLADGRYPATVHALENVEVCSISHARLGEACAASKPMRRRISQLTGMNILREYRAAHLVRQRLSESRVAGFLLELSQTMQERGYSAREFQLRMSRAEIGSYLGIAPETVSRAVSDFQRQGLILVRSRRIELLRLDALRELADERAQE